MAYSINYRFRSYKNYSKIFFDSESLSLWELKYEIISQRRMYSKDFDLVFYDAETDEKLEDEYVKIDRFANLIVEKIPLWMSNNRNNMEFKQRLISYSRVPPETYTCFKCNQKGHYIQHCPNLQNIQQNNASEANLRIMKPRIQEWKKQKNLIKYKNIPDGLKCEECNGLLNEAEMSSCQHYFCKGCAVRNERCPRCRKTIMWLKESSRKQDEVKEYEKWNKIE
ncbi:MPE1 [Enterospora canceri]|uniref:MPE1 n=1 Tax=Enterospora canceri TaxID=1081671 RepID=A0A1Y1S859_9MICR|nr:MPE1 [Enterospora canceri]